jgi:hypothetical protein
MGDRTTEKAGGTRLNELLDLPIAYAEDNGKIILHYSEDDRLVLIEILDLAKFMETDDGGFKDLCLTM